MPFFFAGLLLSANTAVATPHKTANTCQMLHDAPLVKTITPPSSQIIVVQSLGGIKANMTLCQRQGMVWKPKYQSAFDAVIGGHGVGLAEEKKEVDL
jgi:hypothetical protein